MRCDSLAEARGGPEEGSLGRTVGMEGQMEKGRNGEKLRREESVARNERGVSTVIGSEKQQEVALLEAEMRGRKSRGGAGRGGGGVR